MGTLFRIKLYAEDEKQARKAFSAGFRRVAELDDTLSDYKSESEINRVVALAVNHPVPISNDLFRVLAAAQALAQRSDGAFDVTIGPLTHLWRDASKTHQPPDAESIKRALARCGYRKLHLNEANRTLELDQAGMQLDVGGIAKGDAADQALLALKRCGIRSALVAASGDLAFSDAPPDEAGWKIGLDSFDQAAAPFTRVLLLANGAVSTSGATEQHLDAAGVRYSHILDPHSGLALTRDITVSVIAKHGIDADGLATAISVTGSKLGLSMVEQEPDAAALVVTVENGHADLQESHRFHLLRAGS